MRHTLAGLLALIIATPLMTPYGALAQDASYDPVRQDPPVVDREFPASKKPLTFLQDGEEFYGILYYAQGIGPHPTLILLHGFPGFEQNLDLAQALRRSGFNVVSFHYRGSWGSQGTYSIVNARDDAGAVVRHLRTLDDPRIDAANLGLIGHSFGGFIALQAAAEDRFIGCTAALAPTNMGVMATAVRDDPDYRAELEKDSGDHGPVQAGSGADLIAELEAHPEFEVTSLGDALAPRPLLLIGATNDTTLPTAIFHEPVAVAFQSLDWPSLEVLLMDGDHSFSWNRIALTDKVTDWAQRSCQSVPSTP